MHVSFGSSQLEKHFAASSTPVPTETATAAVADTTLGDPAPRLLLSFILCSTVGD